MTTNINELIVHMTSEISRAFERSEIDYPNNRNFDLSCDCRFVTQDPYVFAEFTDTNRRQYTGFAKRCPRDKPDTKRGISIAVFRAVRDSIRTNVFDIGTPSFHAFK